MRLFALLACDPPQWCPGGGSGSTASAAIAAHRPVAREAVRGGGAQAALRGAEVEASTRFDQAAQAAAQAAGPLGHQRGRGAATAACHPC